MKTTLSGCSTIDNMLNGGFRSSHITEVYGDEGTGMTQLCLQMMLAAQLSPSMGGLGSASVYIQSIGEFPSGRINDMIPLVFGSTTPKDRHPLEKILVKKVESPQDLVGTVQWLEIFLQSEIGKKGNYQVVVIDSISSICRFHFTNTRESMMERTAILIVVSNGLRSLANKYDLVIVAVNNVVEVSQTDYEGSSNMIMSNGRKVKPALGRMWYNNICTRIFMSKNFNSNSEVSERTMLLLSSPISDVNACNLVRLV
ncbi:DNA repair protein XRCC3 homolog [Chenopodium quinoa]|uniref:DNA repair protein XRCC3 homolog n=1 Tax=Chenopodium quinoa TaxID=63459 RepID=UPI000B773F2F|nr:DNA repair protein XRCC3 homolog [Chenopodium quinoa]